MFSATTASGFERTRDEIDCILDSAKLDRDDLLPLSQEIMFDCKFSGNDLRLIELGGPEIMEAIKIGSSLVFRGDVNDAAVLCTKSSTFEIKEAETSNSLLIMEKLAFPDRAGNPSPNSSPLAKKLSDCVLGIGKLSETESDAEVDNSAMEVEENLWMEQNQILSVAHSYFEVKKIKPNLSRIHTILFSSKYRGPEYESEQAVNLITFEELLDKVPASSQEIQDYIEIVRAIEINGFIRLVEEEYLFRALSQVLNCGEENSWGKDNFVKNVVMNSLKSVKDLYPPLIVEKIFQWFFTASGNNSEETQEPGTSSADNVFSFKENEMCRFLGEILLKPVGRFNLKDFLKAWQDSVPEGLKTNLKQLDGLAVSDTDCLPPLIWYFPEYNLPDSVAERFAMLFETKVKWRQDEIIPYVQSVVASVNNVGTLLTKFSRVTTNNGVKYCSSKHSK